jgi:hypothetical protein
MITWLIIGFIVQAIIIIERAIRLPEILGLLDWKDPMTWVGSVGAIIFNVLVWPLAIVAEGINIYYGQ